MFVLLNNPEHFELGKTIRRRRQSLGISQGILADLSGVARHTITDIESGKGNPTLEVVRKLLAPLGLRMALEIAEPQASDEEVHP